jgi:hypothetical protein
MLAIVMNNINLNMQTELLQKQLLVSMLSTLNGKLEYRLT